MSYDVFLSYSREDTIIVKYFILPKLNAAGLRIWQDETDIDLGHPNWQKSIEQGIHDSRCVLAILSPDAKDSKWVLAEIAVSEDKHKRIFGALVRGNNNTSVPLSLKLSQYIDISRDDNEKIENLIAEIIKFVSPLRPALPAPASPESTISQEIPQQTKTSPSVKQKLLPHTIDAVTMSKLINILDAAKNLFPNPKPRARACLFWVDEDNDELYIIAATDGFSYQELQLRFEKGRGFVGEVWRDEKAKIANPSVAITSLKLRWNLSPEEVKITEEIKSIIAFPIQKSEKIIGILSIDSRLPPQDAGLDNTEDVERITNAAYEMIEIIKSLRIPPRPTSFRRYLNLRNVLRVSRLVPPLEVPIRASIYVPDQSMKHMEVAITSDREFEGGDLSLRFKKLQGLVGHIWEKQVWLEDNRENMTEQDLKRTWDMTNEQIRSTRDIKSVVGCPAFDDTNQIIGILTISSKWPMNQSQLDQYRDEFELLSKITAKLLLAET